MLETSTFYKHFIRALLLFFFLLTLYSSKAQTNFIYSIGFTPPLSMNSFAVPTYTDPLIFSQSLSCISVNSGISKYLSSGLDQFSFSCLAESPEKLDFILFPNPTNLGFAFIRLKTKVSTTGDFLIKIVGYNGVVNITKTVSQSDILNGLRVTLLGVPPGGYIINILSISNGLQGSEKLIILK